jgi:hypothetical protein
MSTNLISTERLERNQIPIYVVALVLDVCPELASLLGGLALLRGAPTQSSGPEPSFCVVERDARLLQGGEEG